MEKKKQVQKERKGKLTNLYEYLFVNGTIIENGEHKFVQAVSRFADGLHLIQLVALPQVQSYRLVLLQSNLVAIHLLQTPQKSWITHHSLRSFPGHVFDASKYRDAFRNDLHRLRRSGEGSELSSPII